MGHNVKLVDVAEDRLVLTGTIISRRGSNDLRPVDVAGGRLVLAWTVNRQGSITIGNRLILVGWFSCDRVSTTAALGSS